MTDPAANRPLLDGFGKATMQYDYERFLAELGARVKQLRKERKLTHRRMVTDFDFHLGQLAKIENGIGVSMQTMLKLCVAFDMPLEEFVRGLGQDKIPK
jgi:transcriptional regulator with XRE-family HTH domain